MSISVNISDLYPETRVLSGRDKGQDTRIKLNLEDIEKQNGVIEIKIDERFFSINPSFFLGCFGNSVRSLGEKKFREKYTFVCSDVLKENIDRGIKRALQDVNILKY